MRRAIIRDRRLVPPDPLRSEGHVIPIRSGGDVLAFHPSPLGNVLIEQETPEGPYVDRLLFWRAEDAARCRACTTCTFNTYGNGYGSCHVRQVGSFGDRSFLEPWTRDDHEVDDRPAG